MTTATRPPLTPEQSLERRQAKAAEILANGLFQKGSNGSYWVQAQSEPNRWYRVSLNTYTCTCEDEKGRQLLGTCKHLLALEGYLGNVPAPQKPTEATEKPVQPAKAPQAPPSLDDLRRCYNILFTLANALRIPEQADKDALRTVAATLRALITSEEKIQAEELEYGQHEEAAL